MSKNTNISSPSSKTNLLLYGRHAILSAIKNKKRKIYKIFCSKDNREELLNTCQKNNLSANLIHIVEKKELDKMLPHDAVHQGIVMSCEPLENYSLENICLMAEKQENCHVLILDQVTDPQNIGAIIRSCVAFNTLALILQDKNAPLETGAMTKAAAGTIEHLPICRVTNLSRAIQQLKNSGFWVIGMDGYATTYIDSIDKSGKIAIVMGSEGKGMRRLVEEACDSTVKLPISPEVESLNVSTAAAITLYEINKDKKCK